MTYNVFSGTLNPTHSPTHCTGPSLKVFHLLHSDMVVTGQGLFCFTCNNVFDFYGRLIWQAILFCSWGFSFFSSFFLAYSQRSQIGCLPYSHTWCGLSANLECRSQMCLTQFAENTGRKNSPKIIRHLHTIAQICRAISSQLRHMSTIRKKC